jgi:hypothetical protein
MKRYDRTEAIARFHTKYEKKREDECWLWGGHMSPDGYGQIKFDRRTQRAHRVALSLQEGLRPGMFVCHTCDIRLCVNPAHLFQGTAKDNVRDMLRKQRHFKGPTQCKRGHEFDAENTFWYRDGRRDCRTCMKVRMHQNYITRKLCR